MSDEQTPDPISTDNYDIYRVGLPGSFFEWLKNPNRLDFDYEGLKASDDITFVQDIIERLINDFMSARDAIDILIHSEIDHTQDIHRIHVYMAIVAKEVVELTFVRNTIRGFEIINEALSGVEL